MLLFGLVSPLPGEIDTVAGRVFWDLTQLVRARAAIPHLHASVETTLGPVDDPGVLVTVRDHPLGRFVGLYNVTAQARPFELHRLHDLGLAHPFDALSGRSLETGAMGLLWLPPYAAWWVVDAPAG